MYESRFVVMICHDRHNQEVRNIIVKISQSAIQKASIFTAAGHHEISVFSVKLFNPFPRNPDF